MRAERVSGRASVLDEMLEHCARWAPRFRRIRHEGERRVALAFVRNERALIRRLKRECSAGSRSRGLGTAFELGRLQATWALRDELMMRWDPEDFRRLQERRGFVLEVIPPAERVEVGELRRRLAVRSRAAGAREPLGFVPGRLRGDSS